jgi:hypothetical protein
LQALTLVVAPLRTLLGLVPIGWPIFMTIMLAALLTWAPAELPCRWAADVGSPSKRRDGEPGKTDGW